MKTILLILAASISLRAQQSLSSPVTVGGVNCGEVRLKEAFSTGSLYSTIKTCRNAFGRLENTFVDGAGTTYLSADSTQVRILQNLIVSDTITGPAYSQIGLGGSPGNYMGYVQLNKSGSSFATVLIEGDYQTSGGYGAISLQNPLTFSESAKLAGSDGSSSGNLSLKTSAGVLGLFASGAGSISLYSGPNERLRLNTTFSLRDTGGIVTQNHQDNWIDIQQLAAPGNPASGYIRAYGKTGVVGLCFRDFTGTENCPSGSGGSFVDLTTNQNFAGTKFTTGAFRATELAVRASSGSGNVFQSYVGGSGHGTSEWFPSPSSSLTAQMVGNYSSTGVAGLSFLDPSTTAETVRISGGSTGTFPLVAISRAAGQQARLGAVSTGGYLNLYDGAVALRVEMNFSSSVGLRLRDSSGNSRLVLDGSGSGAGISSAGNQVLLTQTGDSIGASSLSLQNRAGAGGLVLTTGGVDVADFLMTGSSGSTLQIRMEGRSGSWTCGYGSAELLFGNPSSALPFGVSTSGTCINGSRPMRFMGSSSGFAALKAPASVTSYTLDLPSAVGSAGQCLSLASTTALTWTSCGGGGSFMDLTTAQTAAGLKYFSSGMKAVSIGAATSAAGASWVSIYPSGSTYGVVDVWSSTGASFPTVQTVGNYAGNGIGAISFVDPTSGFSRIRIQGGHSSLSSQIVMASSTGNVVSIAGSQTLGGSVTVYNSSNIAQVEISGLSGIRVNDGFALTPGITTTISTAGCNIAVTKGIITGKSGGC